MKKQLLAFIFAVFCSMAWGQATVTPKVIAATGNYAKQGDLEVSYTIGEMTAVTTAGSLSGVHATQGFHQPEEMDTIATMLNNLKHEALAFAIYPNPASHTLWTGFEMAETGSAKLVVSDVAGRLIEAVTAQYEGGKTIRSFDVSSYSAGSYLLTLQFTTAGGQSYSRTKQFSIKH